MKAAPAVASPRNEKINEFVVVLQENWEEVLVEQHQKRRRRTRRRCSWEEVLAEQHQKAVCAETLPADAVPAEVPEEGGVPAVVLAVALAPPVAQVVPAVVLLVELAPAVAQHGTWLWGGRSCLLASPGASVSYCSVCGQWVVPTFVGT